MKDRTHEYIVENNETSWLTVDKDLKKFIIWFVIGCFAGNYLTDLIDKAYLQQLLCSLRIFSLACNLFICLYCWPSRLPYF
jgi:hypothetical protein